MLNTLSLALFWLCPMFFCASLFIVQCGCKKKKKKNKKRKATLINPPSQPKIAAATAMGVKPQPQTIQGAGVKQQPMKTQIAGPTKTKANLPPPPLSRVPKMKKQKQSARTDPRFGAINSDLMSRAEPYSQIRRTPMPPPRTQFQSRLRLPAPRPAEATKPVNANNPDYDTLNFVKKGEDIFASKQPAAKGPKAVNEKPNQQGIEDTGNPDYDTLNFIKQGEDIFASGDAGGKEEEDEPDQEDEDNADDVDESAPQQGMADDAGGEYETLADLHKDDIFGAGKED